MKRTHYIYRNRINNRDHYFIWFSGETGNSDGVIVSTNNTIPNFVSIEELKQYAEENHITPFDDSEENPISLDVVAKWLKMKKMKRMRRVDCKEFLAAWNLFDDISKSTGGNFDPDTNLTQVIYDKLFWGNNLPSLTPEGKCYVPRWTGREIQIMHDTLAHGLALFRQHVKRV